MASAISDPYIVQKVEACGDEIIGGDMFGLALIA